MPGDRLSAQRVTGAVRASRAAFREGLREAGYVEGQNVALDFRWPRANTICLPTLRGRSGAPSSGCDRIGRRDAAALAAKSVTGRSDRVQRRR